MLQGFAPVRLAMLAGLALVVFTLCWGVSHYFEGAAGVSAVWPVNAIVLAFKLRLSPTRRDARLALVTAYLAMVAANLVIGRPLDIAVIFPLANVVEIMVAVWFMRRTAMPMCGMKDIGQFLLGAVVAGPLASTLIAGTMMWARVGIQGPELVSQAGAWLLSDLMGMAIIAPFALSLGTPSKVSWPRALAMPTAIFIFCFLLCWQARVPVMFLAFPIVTLAVINDRDRGGALGVAAVAFAVVAAAMLNQGPIMRVARLGIDPVMLVQIFLGALVLTVHPLAAIMRRLDLAMSELDQRRETAEHDSAAKSELIGRVGEELRSPLTGVVTVAEMLRSGRLGDLNDRQRDLLARIAESGAEIESLSREMVALADGGQLAARSAPIAAVVTDAIAATRFRANRARVTLQALPGEVYWRADIDADRLKRMIQEALGQALDAAPAGTTVRVVAGLEGDGGFTLTIEDAGTRTLADREARFAAARIMTPAADGMAFDRAELRRHGGDLRFGPGALGGGKLTLLLPRAPDEAAIRAA
ncbi:MAG: hypothetical protein EON89_09025 [Brevundimonas sp.]|nr:MAG: hypothetical protein EON89_09025 [Brevundimonas sp.]